MSALTPTQAERSRKNLSLILSGLRNAGLEPVAKAINKDGSTVSKMSTDGRFEEFATMLAAMDLKVVPMSMDCYPKDYIRALHTMAKISMTLPPDTVPETAVLSWE